MKTLMTNRVTEGKFWLYTNTESIEDSNIERGKLTQAESEVSIIESIIETIVEPIIYKC
ncbi:hypothetical protein L1S35_08605 [Flavobacterium sp. AS60]|uniref:hypothetical protein n=1 Tax=Flavobacterium anseongense TaxID=2910677 RepID=UPI001F36AFAD|nr:hypothetical protein [Flavobacterium sp. AS60]MCF6129732.1 hypothetical protein [Flavobacterium sp. AS60]